MQESKIEQELLEAVKPFPEKKKEERQAYLVRLMRAAAKVKDSVWEGFTSEAQDWVNGGAEAFKAGDALEDFPDYEEVEEEQSEDEEVDEEAEEEKPEPVKAKPEKKQEAKPVKEPKTVVAPRKMSACHMIKKMVVKDPKISVEDLSKQLKDQGLKVSDVTIATLRSDLRDTLRVMNELKLGTFVLG